MSSPDLQSSGSHLILYDGICGLCNGMNAFVLKHDKRAHFRFAALQGARAHSILLKYGRNPDILVTFYVVANYGSKTEVLLERARAALFVLKVLGSPWSWGGIFGFLPDRLLNFGYDLVAGNRYRLFGKYDQCLLPPAEHRGRFVD